MFTVLYIQCLQCKGRVQPRSANRCCQSKTSYLQNENFTGEEKTYFTFNVSQWNQTFFPSNFGTLLLVHSSYVQCKGQQAFSNNAKKGKNFKNGVMRFCFDSSVMWLTMNE